MKPYPLRFRRVRRGLRWVSMRHRDLGERSRSHGVDRTCGRARRIDEAKVAMAATWRRALATAWKNGQAAINAAQRPSMGWTRSGGEVGALPEGRMDATGNVWELLGKGDKRTRRGKVRRRKKCASVEHERKSSANKKEREIERRG